MARLTPCLSPCLRLQLKLHHQKLSSIKSRLPSKVIFHQRLSCRVSCCPVWSCLVPYISVWCPMASYGPVLFRIALHSFIWPFRTKCVSLGYLCLPLLCFGNEAARDRYVGWSVGQSVSFNTNFKKVPKMKQILFDIGPLTLVRWPL